VDVIIQRVDMERHEAVGGPIMLPATHRINAASIHRDQSAMSDTDWAAFAEAAGLRDARQRFDLSLGYKEVEPGTYAIVDAYTSESMILGGDRFSGGCMDDRALVFEIERGTIGVLPRSFYRIADERQGGRTGIGEDQFSLAKALAIIANYPNMTAPLHLLHLSGAIRFAPRTTQDLFHESCASGHTFEVVPMNADKSRRE
jgi:hypothetical protein